MSESKMKPESLEEQRDRLLAMSEAEKRGADAATDGQITASRKSLSNPDGPEREFADREEHRRITRSVNDIADDESVEATKAAFAPQADEGDDDRRSSRRSARKSKKADEEQA